MKLWLVFFAPATPDLKGVVVRAETREQALEHARLQTRREMYEPDYTIVELSPDGTPGVIQGVLA